MYPWPGTHCRDWAGLKPTWSCRPLPAECCEYHQAQPVLALLRKSTQTISIVCGRAYAVYRYLQSFGTQIQRLSLLNDRGVWQELEMNERIKEPHCWIPPIPGCWSLCVYPQSPSTSRFTCSSPMLTPHPQQEPSPHEAAPSVSTEPILLQLNPLFFPFLFLFHLIFIHTTIFPYCY